MSSETYSFLPLDENSYFKSLNPDHQEYAYPWNIPREAIASPYLTYDEIHRRNQLNAEKAAQIAALKRAYDLLETQPQIVQFDIKRRMAELEKVQGLTRAKAYLTKTCVERVLPRVERVNEQYRIDGMLPGTFGVLAGNITGNAEKLQPAQTLWILIKRFNRLPSMTRSDVDSLASDIANLVLAELTQAHKNSVIESDYKYAHRLYITAATITRAMKQTPPLWDKVTSRQFDPEEVTPAIMRMQNDKWWKGRLRRVAASWREHLQIALANVSKKHTPYASNTTVSEWREQKRRTREFLKGMELEDEEGNRISLIEKYDGSVANPAIRRCELMTRIRGFENICNEMGFVGEFFTLTAPARYHATIKTGHRNRKWNGASPADTQRYLCSVWQKIRAKLHRKEIRIFGIRVAEPHHDATPHWHMLMFMRPDEVDQVRDVMRDYAYQVDFAELTTDKARKARFHAEAIDPDKGSATGYVAKYISKNIDGYALDGELDDESGKELKETASAVSAWAARWHIRQFQFVGGAPVTVYRELRRMADSETAHGLNIEFAAAHDAADAGDWAGYVNAQGGPFVRRDELAVRTWYQPSDDFNEYGEETLRIRGVYATEVGDDTPILTRLAQWKIVPKRAVDLAVELKGAPAPSWSSVNNCTAPPDDDPPIDFTRPPTRAERRRILKRLHESTPAKPRKKRQAPVSDRYRVQREQLKESFYDVSRLTLSEGEVTRMMMGHKLKVGAQIFWSGTSGHLFTDRRKPSTALQRFNTLAAQHRRSSNVQ